MMTVTYGKGFEISESMQQKVKRLEAELLRLPQVDCPVSHYFAPHLALRKIEIKKGVIVTGAVHKIEHLIVIAKGKLQIVTDSGTKEVSAGDVVRCMPGLKNAVVALEDSAWINCLVTDEINIDKIVTEFTESQPQDLLGGSTNKQLAANRAAGILEE